MNTYHVHRLLYSLKRQWGTSFDYFQILLSEVDDRTGTRRIQRELLKLSAVLLPQNQIRKFIQDIGYLAADKNFTYGGLNDYNTLTIVIDAMDLPKNFQVNLNGYINYNGKRYERVSFSNLAEAAYILIARGVEGAYKYGRLEETCFNELQFQEVLTYELN